METKSKKRYIPSSFLTIIGLMIVFIIASWIGKAATDSINGIGILDVFTSIWHGFSSKVDVILFILAIGGTLGIMTKIKAIDAGIDALVRKLGNRTLILIPVLMLIFGLGGTSYGMWEETVAFIPVLIPVFKKAGYGPFTAMLVILIGAGTGCLASTVNPFSTGAAVSAIAGSADVQAIAPKGMDLSTTVNSSLQGTRWLSFAIFELVGIALVMWQATRYKKGKDIVSGLEEKLIAERFKEKDGIEFTTKRKISLSLFVLAFVLMIVMYLPWGNWFNGVADTNGTFWTNNMWWLASTTSTGFASLGNWYFISVSGLFTLITIIIFAFNFNEFKTDDENQEQGFIKTYVGGMKDMVSVSLLIGVAGGLGIILDETNIGIEIANSIANAKLGMVAFGVVVFLLSIILSALVPSTSGFAAAFMPTFAVVAFQSGLGVDGVGVAILAFLFANGLANFFTPTSAALMGYTSYAGVPYPVWMKQTWKIQVAYFLLALVLIISFSALASGGNAF